jgi:hypothetical protein
MFGFGKKKETKSATQETLENRGYVINSGVTQKKQSRGEDNRKAQLAKESQVKKNNLIERLVDLRKRMINNSEFSNEIDQLDEAINNLRTLPDGDPEAMIAVDSLLIAEINSAISDCNKKSWVSLTASVENIVNFINDRMEGGSYYTDPQYCDFMIEKNRLDKEYKKQKYLKEVKEKRRVEIINALNDPSRHLTKDSVADELMEIREDKQEIDETMASIKNQLDVIKQSLKQIKKKNIAHADDSKFNLDDRMDDVRATKSENEHDFAKHQKYKEMLSQNNTKFSAGSMSINNDNYDTNAATAKQYDDDLFKL